ncbi:hypothetical protein V1512DRAFT_259970 [Lipomyces arxii]|uniref:uncharacterized protein n=1 Tax=Lipomyces arxii TaxID=56418 RepID=UPI0034CEACE6
MAGTDAVPSVPLSFSNNFWGMEGRGITVLFQRMREAKQTCEEVKAFYKERIAIEEEYAKRMIALARKPLGSGELGGLRSSLDTIRSETEQMGKSHQSTAMQIRTELEEPLATAAAGMRERRKVVQVTLEKLAKAKASQEVAVAKNRDRFENDCHKISGYLAQQNMVTGRELERNNAKLERADIAVAASRREYQTSLRILAETTEKWNREWKSGCDKFQDLEEERIDYLKSNLWAYTNIVSTVCVGDDELCENIRLSLENCETDTDILTFIKDRGTGQEIPIAPKFINFMDGSSGFSHDHENYTVAQFSRHGNPQFKTSTAQSDTPVSNNPAEEWHEATNQIDDMLASLSVSRKQPESRSESRHQTHTQRVEESPTKLTHHPLDSVVLYPDETLSSAHSSPRHRPISPYAESIASNPTTISSSSDNDLETEVVKPIKATSAPKDSPDITPKKEQSSGGWTSPFRRKSRSDVQTGWIADAESPQAGISSVYGSKRSNATERAASTRSTPGSHSKSGSQYSFMQNDDADKLGPRAAKVVSIGPNTFEVSPSQKSHRSKSSLSGDVRPVNDPIAAALAKLKNPAGDQVAEDKYHGIGSKPANRTNSGRRVPSYSAPSSPQRTYIDPPPVHNGPPIRQPDFGRPKSAHMNVPPLMLSGGETNEFAADTRDAYNKYAQRSQSRQQSGSPVRRPVSRQNVMAHEDQEPVRRSPQQYGSSPAERQSTRQHRVQSGADDTAYYESASPNPRRRDPAVSVQSRPRSTYGYPPEQQQQQQQQSRSKSRPRSGASPAHYPERGYPGERAPALYDRQKSKSALDLRRPQDVDLPTHARDGRAVVSYARALYDYKASIPEEVSFRKGDILLVLLVQEDGWWEAEVFGPRSRPQYGLAPGNFCQML